MYTVGPEQLPEQELVDEAIEIMGEELAFATSAPHLLGLSFTGEVYEDTSDPKIFRVLGYTGLITSIIPSEPPTFNIIVSEAWRVVDECDCSTLTVDDFIDNPGLVVELAVLSAELDDFAGAAPQDPHYETLNLQPNTEVTIRFDRLGAYGVVGVFR